MMITKREIVVELFWVLGSLLLSLVLIYLLKLNFSFFENGNIGLHDTYFVIDNSYFGLLALFFVPIAYVLLITRSFFTKLKRVLAIIILIILNVLFIAFNSHRIAFFIVFLYTNYILPTQNTGWAISFPADSDEIVMPQQNSFPLIDNFDFWYTVVLLISTLLLVFFSILLGLRIAKPKTASIEKPA